MMKFDFSMYSDMISINSLKLWLIMKGSLLFDGVIHVLLNYMDRSNILQHRLCGKEGNSGWWCDSFERIGKHIKGEECTILARTCFSSWIRLCRNQENKFYLTHITIILLFFFFLFQLEFQGWKLVSSNLISVNTNVEGTVTLVWRDIRVYYLCKYVSVFFCWRYLGF